MSAKEFEERIQAMDKEGMIPPWTVWVAADADGSVFAYDYMPRKNIEEYHVQFLGGFSWLKDFKYDKEDMPLYRIPGRHLLLDVLDRDEIMGGYDRISYFGSIVYVENKMNWLMIPAHSRFYAGRREIQAFREKPKEGKDYIGATAVGFLPDIGKDAASASLGRIIRE